MEHRADADLPPTGHTHAMHNVPSDAQLLGLDRNTEEGALVAMAGSLSAAHPSHRVMAWVLLFAFVAPFLLAIVTAVL